ncbi:MAG: hypothetical protein UT68_C0001G0158 [Parcubacteria group bacterium GW2011_GWC2_40_10]|nr:MAG: hypothetical protein UT25_C0001G0155 [Parcubacteria group bacterium GW2011_GWC1_39_12]KKR19679.1 MAG: hypothetical protein UT49_C0001G0155 [Parcubacteria group bacterium GW2011_GWF1_39_37]KKR35835.1 MAG: hypothetical protein UT68_C0001G0158 [Parcubacteria group bacterium GW2011_GWC2_40_10]KKR52647.1 MAG: hypothetical protein UT89_C0001G0155 [Parcubacteria group bacterium GW2011_GWE1_40_20]KKR65666.1 MAG: hypothetical protein UU06_C0013G0012 [Parcubacteria group bacterium GW2011_GWB1_40_
METKYVVNYTGTIWGNDGPFGPATRKEVETQLRKRGFKKSTVSTNLWYRTEPDNYCGKAVINRLRKMTSLK